MAKKDVVISRTKYSRRLSFKFYLFYMFSSTYSPYMIFIATAVVLGISLTNTFKANEKGMNIIFPWVLTAFCLMMIPLIIIMRINDVIKQETPEIRKSVDTIEVSKHKIERNNSAIEGRLTLSWQQLKLICETKKYFYFYTQENNGFIVVKDDIIEGDAVTLRKIIKENAPLNKRGRQVFRAYYKPVKASK